MLRLQNQAAEIAKNRVHQQREHDNYKIQLQLQAKEKERADIITLKHAENESTQVFTVTYCV